MVERILILEDMESRHKWFKESLVGCNIDLVTTAAEAIELLKSNEYTHLFLDHDLIYPDHYIGIQDDNTTGYAVACFLERNPSLSAASEIIIHTQKPFWREKDAGSP